MSGTAAAFAPKRIPGAEVYDRRDGSWVVLDARSGRHVVLDERQAAIARRLDGRPLADVARETLDERGTIPFGELLGLCRSLATEGLLEGGDESLTGKPGVFERVRRVASVTLAQRVIRSKRLEQIVAADPKVAGKRVLGMQAFAGAAGGMLLAAAGAPVIERVLLPQGNPALGLVLLYVGLSAALAMRGAFRAFAARLSSTAPMVWRLALVAGVLTVDPGSRALAASPRLARVGGAALGVTGLLALAAFYRLLASAAGGELAAQLDVAALAAVLVAFADLCPVGHTAAHDVFTALLPRGSAARDGLSYLRRRAVRRVWAADFFDGERVLIAWLCWGIGWFVVSSRLTSTLVEGNLPPLFAMLGSNAPPATAAVALLLTSGLAALAFASTGAILAGIGTGIAALIPRQEGHSRKLEPSEFDQVHAARLLADVPIFRRLGAGKLQQIAARAKRLDFKKGAFLVTQGAPGDAFYVIWSGATEVLREEASGHRQRLAVLHERDCFGEIALVESVPRTASVRAVSAVVALAVRKEDFTAAVSGDDAEGVLALVRGGNVLRASPLFRELDSDVLAALLRRMDFHPVPAGHVLIKKGDAGDRFYMVVEGAFDVIAEDGKTSVATLGPGEPVGEIALLADSPRTATVVAKTAGALLSLDRASFFEFFRAHLGIGERLERVAGERLPIAKGAAS